MSVGQRLSLETMVELADDAEARAKAEREVREYLARVGQAKRIKARRRKLGQNGFAIGAMAIPGKRALVRTRNSQ